MKIVFQPLVDVPKESERAYKRLGELVNENFEREIEYGRALYASSVQLLEDNGVSVHYAAIRASKKNLDDMTAEYTRKANQERNACITNGHKNEKQTHANLTKYFNDYGEKWEKEYYEVYRKKKEELMEPPKDAASLLVNYARSQMTSHFESIMAELRKPYLDALDAYDRLYESNKHTATQTELTYVLEQRARINAVLEAIQKTAPTIFWYRVKDRGEAWYRRLHDEFASKVREELMKYPEMNLPREIYCGKKATDIAPIDDEEAPPPDLLDLGQDGKLKTPAVEEGVQVSQNKTGAAEEIAWMNPVSALSFQMLSGNGLIDDESGLLADNTLFNNERNAVSGIDVLGELYSNAVNSIEVLSGLYSTGGGILDSTDEKWGSLPLLRDMNDNGFAISPLTNWEDYHSPASMFEAQNKPDSFRRLDAFMAELRTVGHDNPLPAFNEFEAPLSASPSPARQVLFDSDDVGRAGGHDASGMGGNGFSFGGAPRDRFEQERHIRSIAREEAEAMIVDLARAQCAGEFQPVIS